METIVIALALFAAQFGFSQESQPETAEIKWLSIEEAYAQNKENPKKKDAP